MTCIKPCGTYSVSALRDDPGWGVILKSHTIIIFFVLAVVLAGCASISGDSNTLYVQYICNPAGATLYQENTVNLGMCPRTVTYPITEADRARGYVLLKGVTAFWVSGVSSSTTPTIMAYLKSGQQQHFRFERPRDAPNYSVDANYALQLEKAQLLRAQVEAIQDVATNSAVIATNSEQPAPSLRTHCTTNTIGGTTYTNCY